MFSSDLPLRLPSPVGADPAPAVTPAKDSPKTSHETLINRLNFLSFTEQAVTAVFIHRRHGRRMRVKACPQPCSRQEFSGRWVTQPPASILRGGYLLHHLEVPFGRHILQVGIEGLQLCSNGLNGCLSEIVGPVTARRTSRNPCLPLQVRVIQYGVIFEGVLDNFNGTALRLELHATPPQNFLWLDAASPVTLIISDEHGAVLTTVADIVRTCGERLRHSVVVAPRLTDQRRLPGKRHRGQRVNFCPTPQMVFTHPFTGRRVALDINNISGTGFAVSEPAAEAMLLPGLTLNDLQLRLTDTFALPCKAQIVYCRSVLGQPGEDVRHYGLTILDMAIPDHTRLLALMHRAENHRRGISPPLDLERLWEFFFASGFIYPEKYGSIHEYRSEFLETYEQLYSGAPEIARHFVIQEHRHILAHMAMLRIASNAWLIQHHAADRTRSNHAGLDVLQLAGEAIKASQGLYSAHMDYAMCFYRPENRFPHRVFGGVADHYRDRTLCSVDTFAYSHFRKGVNPVWAEEDQWNLAPASAEDLFDLEACYAQRGGGLLLKALDMTAPRPDQAELMAGYRKAGFQYRQDLFALRCNGELTAVFSTMRTAMGLNLSNLTNAITALILSPEELPREAYRMAISTLAAIYPVDEVPVLTYPESYPDRQQLPVEKRYDLWAIDCRHLDPYFDYCETLFRRLRPDKSTAP